MDELLRLTVIPFVVKEQEESDPSRVIVAGRKIFEQRIFPEKAGEIGTPKSIVRNEKSLLRCTSSTAFWMRLQRRSSLKIRGSFDPTQTHDDPTSTLSA